jgi:hypothetical protein
MFNFFDEILAKSGFGLFLDLFKLTFIHSTHLLVNDPLGKVFEHLQDLFDLEDLINNFSQLFPIYVDSRHMPGNITRAFNVMRLLDFTKAYSGIRPITVGEVLY